MADYGEAIRIDPQYAIAYYNRGISWYDKKDYDKAIADYTDAIRSNPRLRKRLRQSRPGLAEEG